MTYRPRRYASRDRPPPPTTSATNPVTLGLLFVVALGVLALTAMEVRDYVYRERIFRRMTETLAQPYESETLRAWYGGK